jgi:hypothetical protein
MANTRNPSRQTSYRVGERVKFKWGGHVVEGEIVEDRGPLGGNGKHLYRITFRLDPWELLVTELAASDLIAADESE